jgi:hypothetical protein
MLTGACHHCHDIMESDRQLLKALSSGSLQVSGLQGLCQSRPPSQLATASYTIYFPSLELGRKIRLQFESLSVSQEAPQGPHWYCAPLIGIRGLERLH